MAIRGSWADLHPVGPRGAAYDLALGTAVGLLGVAASHGLSRGWARARALEERLAAAVGPVSATKALALAMVSSAGEEVLFRGGLQPWFGLWLTGAAFGFLHGFATTTLWVWTVMATAMGWVLGALYAHTEALGAPWAAHFVLNAINLYLLGQRAAITGRQSLD